MKTTERKTKIVMSRRTVGCFFAFSSLGCGVLGYILPLLGKPDCWTTNVALQMIKSLKFVAFKLDAKLPLSLLILDAPAMAALYTEATEKAEQLGLRDYQFSLEATDLVCRTVRGKPDIRRGGACSSCNVALSLGVLLGAAEGSPLDAFANQVLMLRGSEAARVWLDAKKRPMLVVTPSQHVERITELKRELLVAVLGELSASLNAETAKGVTRVIVNIGACQNHPHLHWKVRLSSVISCCLFTKRGSRFA